MGAWGRAALALVDQHADLFAEVASARSRLVSLVREKLAAEPIEDLRIDFEDGYGDRGDEAEDADVLRAAGALARRDAGPARRRRTAGSGSRASRRPPGDAGSGH